MGFFRRAKQAEAVPAEEVDASIEEAPSPEMELSPEASNRISMMQEVHQECSQRYYDLGNVMKGQFSQAEMGYVKEEMDVEEDLDGKHISQYQRGRLAAFLTNSKVKEKKFQEDNAGEKKYAIRDVEINDRIINDLGIDQEAGDHRAVYARYEIIDGKIKRILFRTQTENEIIEISKKLLDENLAAIGSGEGAELAKLKDNADESEGNKASYEEALSLLGKDKKKELMDKLSVEQSKREEEINRKKEELRISLERYVNPLENSKNELLEMIGSLEDMEKDSMEYLAELDKKSRDAQKGLNMIKGKKMYGFEGEAVEEFNNIIKQHEIDRAAVAERLEEISRRLRELRSNLKDVNGSLEKINRIGKSKKELAEERVKAQAQRTAGAPGPKKKEAVKTGPSADGPAGEEETDGQEEAPAAEAGAAAQTVSKPEVAPIPKEAAPQAAPVPARPEDARANGAEGDLETQKEKLVDNFISITINKEFNGLGKRQKAINFWAKILPQNKEALFRENAKQMYGKERKAPLTYEQAFKAMAYTIIDDANTEMQIDQKLVALSDILRIWKESKK